MSPEIVAPVAPRTGALADAIELAAPPELELEHALTMSAAAPSAAVVNAITDDRVDRICTSLFQRRGYCPIASNIKRILCTSAD